MTRSRWIAGLCSLVFCGVWAAVASNISADWDAALLHAFRTTGDLAMLRGPIWTETVLRDLTGLGGVTVLTLTVLGSSALFMRMGHSALASRIIAAVVIGQILSNGLKALFARPRPDLVPHGTLVTSASFPSGHSMMAVVVWLSLALAIARVAPELRRALIGAALTLSALVGVSRVALGVHWPSDVLGGWALGAACAILCADYGARRRG
ncbi:phosphatase PAP2 family protein [Albirhodobacter sp. R86504]|uniref:phosphatase PAP2 family protein n=1 Tax=Albirhodobacter sp. R86504 TaxID=3093848 RepID=UPI00366C6459